MALNSMPIALLTDVLNMQIYKGKSEITEGITKLEALVFSLMEPYLDNGHHLFMDNFYNSVSLAKKLLMRKTHCTGTLRSNRRGNPKTITNMKIKKGQHIWSRSGKVYVSKWKDKRDVLCITTKYHPKIVNVSNRFNQMKQKSEEIAKYNEYMSGIDRSDQMCEKIHSIDRNGILYSMHKEQQIFFKFT
ncbi:hypothetical protein NQ314_009862 [Rhamnusium bicolor]|uniref:PiggyBac transposable element-derived protein domain-containing protein n=1 Tax=Rhamnusium bicolor TaxID=1586634 RepID=A0AAV8XW92_9CUCU|nr:hypothetical protein NQ314_009862 [Rhamnusium bicolor]